MTCSCRDCKNQKRKGRVLGIRSFRHMPQFGEWFSDYVAHRKYQKGRTRKIREEKHKKLAIEF